jgi:flagellar P-ring protein precursor FlgI
MLTHRQLVPERPSRAAHFVTVLLLLVGVGASLPAGAAPAVRIKDLTEIEGVRTNALVGYGLVVGLQGTGDGTQARFTIQSLANLLRRSGVTVPQESIRVRNVAAVMVTTELPAFARPGQRLDVQVASVGDAKSLQGGTLLMTPLSGPDGGIYAVAQGAVSIGGAFLGGGGGNSVQKNHPTAGRVVSGAAVERQVPLDLASFPSFRLQLRQADFATAQRIAGAINDYFDERVARAEDPGGVRVNSPARWAGDPVGLLAEVEALEVRPDVVARVVINERTGTVVMGSDVRVSKVALAHGNLTIEVRTDLEVSQPAAFSKLGQTKIVPQQEVRVHEGPLQVLTLEEGISVGELVDALNAVGVSSRDMVAIFQAMRAAGALHAELVVL